jgi:hypothetical protein
MSGAIRIVYVAAPFGEKARASRVADDIALSGFAISSRWHYFAKNETDPTGEDDRLSVLSINIGDLERADLLFALTDIGTPRATIGEITWALRMGKPVIWIQGPNGEGRNLFDAHPLVRRATSLEGGLIELGRLAWDYEAKVS